MDVIRIVTGRRAALASALALALTGCSEARDDLPREAVSGKVKIEGAPVPKGSIQFRSADGSMEVGGVVKDGAFAIPKADGPVPGKYKVSVTEAVEGAVDPSQGTAAHFSIAPASKPSTKVISGPIDAEVKAGGADAFDFEFQRLDAAHSKGRRR
ncbi:hypothetical protein [Paludisphaera borealis]|uniref:Carboxypeptidase regulatory-like domain-containing protein n=1 Tax=Paludisphaera borealis TaxID=1387353 RepID=A0A1U7CTD7_9BACT|nr:hypothetical protein [Paludisphaera borealis]APW62178.1 hypothetical protein BSF38_03710 [Paludisphaera borealis]